MARNSGWVPNQHGAWAMLVVPFVVGAVRGAQDHGFCGVLIPLFGLWIVGYFAFFAAGLWLKSRRRQRYLRPLLTYGVVAGLCGVAVLVLDPGLAIWALAFAPFLALGLWAAASRTERTVLAGGAMVAAASLMTVVAYRAGEPEGYLITYFGDMTEPAPQVGDPVPDWMTALLPHTPIWLLAGLLFAYFFGTVLYVKSMIRGRGVRAYEVASVAYHAAVTIALIPLAMYRDGDWWWAVAFFVALTVRAQAMLGRAVSPKALGIGEVVASSAALALGLTLG